MNQLQMFRIEKQAKMCFSNLFSIFKIKNALNICSPFVILLLPLLYSFNLFVLYFTIVGCCCLLLLSRFRADLEVCLTVLGEDLL